MKKTLYAKAKEIVTQGAHRDPCYDNITDTQREQLTALVMRKEGANAYKLISNTDALDSIACTLINALEATDAEDHKDLLIKLGELLIATAVYRAKPVINDALGMAATELAIMRQFSSEFDEDDEEFDEEDDELSRLIYDDNAERARDMNKAIRGY